MVGLITDNNEKASLKELEELTCWCQDNNLLLNSKTLSLADGGLVEEAGKELCPL